MVLALSLRKFIQLAELGLFSFSVWNGDLVGELRIENPMELCFSSTPVFSQSF